MDGKQRKNYSELFSADFFLELCLAWLSSRKPMICVKLQL
jgi:hypothetical protein